MNTQSNLVTKDNVGPLLRQSLSPLFGSLFSKSAPAAPSAAPAPDSQQDMTLSPASKPTMTLSPKGLLPLKTQASAAPLAPSLASNQANIGTLQNPNIVTAPSANTAPTSNPAPTAAPAPAAPVGGTQLATNQTAPSQNAQRVLDYSQPSAVAQGAGQAQAAYSMLGDEAKLAPFAGGTSQNLLQSYADLTRPQSTGNMTGELGLFNAQNGILQNAANVAGTNQIAQNTLATNGASGVLNASLPQQVSPGNAYVNPLTGTPVAGFDTASAINRGAALANAPEQYSKVSNTQTALNTIDANTKLFATLNQLNPSDATPINDVISSANKYLSSADYANLSNLTNSLRSSYIQILESRGSTPTDATSKANSLIPDNMSIGSMKKVLSFLNSEGQNALNESSSQYGNTIQGGSPAFGSTASSGGTSFQNGQSAADGQLVFINGKWQKAQ